MVRFLSTWGMIIIVFWILSLAGAIFGPLMMNTLDPLVDNTLNDAANKPQLNGDHSAFRAQLYAAKTMVVLFFNFFFYAMSAILLGYGFISSLKKEQSDYPIR